MLSLGRIWHLKLMPLEARIFFLWETDEENIYLVVFS